MKTNLCQHKHLSCFGCCGHLWDSKGKITAQIKENTRVFQILNKSEFRSRAETPLAPCGACKALIINNKEIFCGLHPLQNNDEDWRDKTCDRGHFCKTFKVFKTWNAEKQKRFLKFIESKKLTPYTYSMGMDSGKFLREFERIRP